MTSLAPRKIKRWKEYETNKRIENPEFVEVTPVPFGAERAKEIYEACRYKGLIWSEFMESKMTDEEIAYVHAVWDTLDGSSSFATAFFKIMQGQDNEVPNHRDSY